MSSSADIAGFTATHSNNLVHSNDTSITNPSSISTSSDRTASPLPGAASTTTSSSNDTSLTPSLSASSCASLSSSPSLHMPSSAVILGANTPDNINRSNLSPDLAVPTPSSSSPSFLSPALPGTTSPRFLQEPSLSEVAPRSSSLPFFAMGHSYSRSSPPVSASAATSPSASTSPAASPAPHPKSASSPPSSGSGAFNLKRAIAGRRKKSEDSSTLFSRTSGKTREQDASQIHAQEQRRIDQMQNVLASPQFQVQVQPYQHQQKQVPGPLALTPTSPSSPTQVKSLSSLAHRGGAKQLTQLASQVFSSKKANKNSPTSAASPIPPTPPPKSARHRLPHAQYQASPPPLPETASVPADATNQDRMSIIPISPAISSAVNYLRMREDEKDSSSNSTKELVNGVEKGGIGGRGSGEKEKADKNDMKESWRKSDSTIGHHTIRPGATAGTKGSRPVSMAESLQSNHTIVPVSKRQSALIDDADFGMPEEEDDARSVNELVDRATLASVTTAASPPPPAPTPKKSNNSLKSKNRRSMSLSLGHLTKSQSQGPAYHHNSASVSDLKHPSISYTEGVPPTPPASDHGHGFYPSSSVSSHSTAGSGNIRGKLAAWTGPPSVSSFSSGSSRQERGLPAVPQQPSLRQTAISMTTGFPAGFAKRAVEKMGRAWGMSSSSSASGYSSSASSNTGPSSYTSNDFGMGLARTNSNTSTPSAGHINVSLKGKHRRTPGGASGTHSVTSSITSESEYAPVLGRQIRGKMKSKSGGAVPRGVVFGRELRLAVQDTAVGVGVESGDIHADVGQGREDLRKLEDRKVPALVVRCAQHMLVWGVQEEGLFRISGRATHTNKIRSEFDSGADYDMLQCSLGDLDPHAVASVFKAYLRELPEPILTTKLSPYFDAAISKEAASNPPEPSNSTSMNASKGQGLPSNPRSGGTLPVIRKAPSLSTLAMPSFAGLKPPSKSLINALMSLVAQLPDENRDLLRTLVELINATAEHKETKMPLSNLLLILCPSLNMNAPLLRALCEVREIWADVDHVIDIKRESVVDITAPNTAAAVEDEDGEDEFSDAQDGNEADSVQSIDQASVDEAASDYDASGESSLSVADVGRQKRSIVIDRSEVPTVYLDTQSRFSNNSVASSTRGLGHTRDLSSTSSFLQDTSSLSSNDLDGPLSHQCSISPPPLSRSTDSVASPPTTSSQPSLADLSLNEVQHSYGMSKSSQDVSSPVPQIEDSTPLPLNTAPRKPTISSPIPSSVVQFPSSPTVESLHAPNPLKRRSIPLLSLPNFSPLTGTLITQPPSPADSIASQRVLRNKKPSLRLLFSKRSTSSLNGLNAAANSRPVISGPIQVDSGNHSQSPISTSDSSVSTPRSVVTAPFAASVPSLPPVLDTPIEGSSLGMELGISISPPSTATTTDQRESPESMNSDPLEPLKPGETPIADRYLSSAASSQISLAYPTSQLRPTPIMRGRGASVSSTASSNHLGILDDGDSEEDWTQSVLLAADVTGEWKVELPAQS